MDRIDKKILSELQRDGRLSITELATRVGLSVSPCHRRLRILEEEGVIERYRAELHPEAVGLKFSALLFVTIRDGASDALLKFEEAVQEVPQIIDAQRLFGEPDYLLKVVAKDLPAFQALYDSKLSSLPNVQKLNSTLVMKTLAQNRALPL